MCNGFMTTLEDLHKGFQTPCKEDIGKCNTLGCNKGLQTPQGMHYPVAVVQRCWLLLSVSVVRFNPIIGTGKSIKQHLFAMHKQK